MVRIPLLNTNVADSNLQIYGGGWVCTPLLTTNVVGPDVGHEHDREMELQSRLDRSPGIQIVLLRKTPEKYGSHFGP